MILPPSNLLRATKPQCLNYEKQVFFSAVKSQKLNMHIRRF